MPRVFYRSPETRYPGVSEASPYAVAPIPSILLLIHKYPNRQRVFLLFRKCLFSGVHQKDCIVYLVPQVQGVVAV
jgi:hypothetical protein